MPRLCPQCLLSLALRESPGFPGAAGEASAQDGLGTLDRLAAGRVLGERYQIRELLGRGGMGEVFRAFDLKLRVDVALKAVRPEHVESERARELLRREVRSAREVVSPNVCRIFDLVAEDGQELLSMEYVDGVTLGETLRRRGPLALEEAREIAAQFLAGLEAIHQAGLVHRDFKPENVMVTRAGRVVVMDFGLAKLLASGRAESIAGTPGYMPPEQMRGDAVDARTDVFAAGVVLAEMLSVGGAGYAEERQALWRAVREMPPRVPDGPWASLLRGALSPDPRDRPPSARDLSRALEEVTQRLPGFETRRPYPGLASFTEEDAEYFFGRELEVEAFLKKLRRPRLLALVAPSGSGKSSFLRAGVLPALPKGWKALFTTPGSRPFQALARTLVPVFAGDTQATEALLRFEEPATALGLVQRFRQRHEQALVIVDQFEELFTLNPPEVQRRFAELLARLVLEADLHVILSLRDDFLFRCRDHEPLQPAFSELTPLGRLDQGALRRALVQPALACGYLFEDEALVDEMIAEVQNERGALPLIAFAAARLWDRRERGKGQLTRAAYREIGGVAGALAQHAEATLERIGSQRLPIVRELFRNLVTAEGTRSVRERAELLSVFAGPEAVPSDRNEAVSSAARESGKRAEAVSVLDALLEARLLTSYERAEEQGESRHLVEIVHESLLEAWPRLVRWRTQDEDGVQLRDQLRQAAQLWNAKGRSADLLWSGSAFQEFRLWRERYPGSLTAIESEYARAMVDRALRRKRLVRLAVGAAFVAISAVAIAIGLSRQQAVRALDRAEASRLLAIAELRLQADPTEALAFATASLARADSQEARIFTVKALWEAPPALELKVTGQNVMSPAFSPDGKWLAAAGLAADALVWPNDGRGPLVLPGHETNPRGGIWAQWAANDLLVTGLAGSAGSRVRLWSIPGGRQLRTIDFGRPSWWQVGSRRLLVETPNEAGGAGGGLLRSWTLPDGEPVVLGRDVSARGAIWTALAPDSSSWLHAKGLEIQSLPLPVGAGPAQLLVRLEAELVRADVSHDPDRLVVAEKSGRTRVWSLDAGRASLEKTILKPDTAPAGAVLDRSGRWLANEPAVDQLVRLWDLTQWSAARPLTLRRNLSWYVSRTAFDASGRWIAASTGRLSRLTLWPLQRPYPIVVDGYATGLRRPLVFSPDGRWLATSWADRRLRLWSLTNGGMRDARPMDPSVPLENWGPIAFDPTGRYLFAMGSARVPWIFPLDGSATRLPECPVGDSRFSSAADSPSGRRIAAATYYGAGLRRLCTWDLDTGEARNYELPPSDGDVGSRTGYERGVSNLAFEDERTVFTAGDGGLRRWDLETGLHEVIAKAAPGRWLSGSFSANARVALLEDVRMGQGEDCREARLYELASRRSRPFTGFGPCGSWQGGASLDASGEVVATAGRDGIVRVGRLGAEPHLLLGYKGAIDRLAISPDLRWVATTGEDNTLRLWPMPDLSKPPLHTLPHAELLAKLRSLTNIRVVADSSTSEGWRLEVGPFPGWKEAPEW